MGSVTRPQLQVWLREWHKEGTLPFDAESLDQPSYMGFTAMLDLQPQLQAAWSLFKDGEWSRKDYNTVRDALEYEHNPERNEHVGSAEVFSPFAVEASPWSFDKGAFEAYQQDIADGVDPVEALAKYTKLLGVIAPTGKVEASEGVKPDKRSQKSANPLRNKSGSFAFGVGQLWFYDPRKGELDQRPFTGKRAIAKAFGHCAELQASWEALGVKLPCAWVKVRLGSRRKTVNGREGVVLVDARGIIASPQALIRLHGQALGQGIKSPVGEVVIGTKLEHVIAMLEQNKLYRGDNDLRNIDVPTVEPSPKNEIAYRIKMLSKRFRTKFGVPLPDVKDDDGNVILEGHRQRAYRFLLDSPCEGADSPSSIKYVVYGKFICEKPRPLIIGHDEALKWAAGADEDETLKILSEAYEAKRKREGKLTDADRQQYMTARWTRLQEIDPIAPGKHEAKERWQEELYHANQTLVPVLDQDGNPKIGKKTGKPVLKPMISDEQYARMVNWNHPAHRERSGPACHQPMTRIDYNEAGRHVWGNASNDGGPGTNWVSGNTRRPNWHKGMCYLEAQLYNMPA